MGAPQSANELLRLLGHRLRSCCSDLFFGAGPAQTVRHGVIPLMTGIFVELIMRLLQSSHHGPRLRPGRGVTTVSLPTPSAVAGGVALLFNHTPCKSGSPHGVR